MRNKAVAGCKFIFEANLTPNKNTYEVEIKLVYFWEEQTYFKKEQYAYNTFYSSVSSKKIKYYITGLHFNA